MLAFWGVVCRWLAERIAGVGKEIEEGSRETNIEDKCRQRLGYSDTGEKIG